MAIRKKKKAEGSRGATGKATTKPSKPRVRAAEKVARARSERRAEKKAERTLARKKTNKKKLVVERSAAQGAARQTRKTASARREERELDRRRTPTRAEQRRQALHEKKDANRRRASERAEARKRPTAGTLTLAALDATGSLERATGTVHETVWLPAIPLDVYNTFLETERHGPTGGRRRGRPVEGAPFETWDGAAFGTTLELVPGQRVVQEWTTDGWPDGIGPSTVTLTLFERDEGTEVHLEHAGVPADRLEEVAENWQRQVFEPLRLHLEG